MTPPADCTQRARVKPRRSILRPRNVLLSLALLVIVGIVLVAIPVVRISRAVPGGALDTHGRLLELTEQFQPEGVSLNSPNAYDMLSALIERERPLQLALDQRLDAESRRRFGPSYQPTSIMPDAVWDPNEPKPAFVEMSATAESAAQADYNALHVEYTRLYIETMEAEGILDELDRIAATPRAVRPFDEQTGMMVLALMMPDLGRSRALARFERARAEFARRDSDADSLVNAVSHLLALSRIHMHQPILIERLVGIAIGIMAAEATGSMVNSDLPEASLSRLLDLWLAHDSIPPPSFAMEGERAFMLDAIAWTHSDDGAGSGYALPVEIVSLTGQSAGRSPSVTNIPGLALARRNETTRVANEYYDDIALAADTSPAGRSSIPVRHDIERLSERFALIKTLVPALDKVIATEDRFTCIRAGTQTLLAIDLHRARQASLPQTLDDLVPSILPALPEDPYAADGRFIYRVLDAPDEHARDYLLYSVAADGQDNNAAPANTDQSTDAFRPDHPGTDYLFTPPSP